MQPTAGYHRTAARRLTAYYHRTVVHKLIAGCHRIVVGCCLKMKEGPDFVAIHPGHRVVLLIGCCGLVVEYYVQVVGCFGLVVGYYVLMGVGMLVVVVVGAGLRDQTSY